MEEYQKMIERYYAEKGLDTEVLVNLAPGFLFALGYGAELFQNKEE